MYHNIAPYNAKLAYGKHMIFDEMSDISPNNLEMHKCHQTQK